MRLELKALVCLLLVASVNPSAASKEPYLPLYDVDPTSAPSALMKSYMRAYNARDRESAIREWERFIREYAKSSDMTSFQDATDLSLVRQAHNELMRLYYIVGRTADADSLLMAADKLVIYSAPAPQEAELWCRKHRYCDP